MADLDDFFAKKDKKKSKAKPKVLTVEDLVKPPIEQKRDLAETKNTEPESDSQQTTSTVEEVKEDPAEEEWKDFEEEQRKDYTGLKIGQLTIRNSDDDQSGSNDEEENDSDGNVVNEGISKRGGPAPWKKVIPAEEVTQIPMEPEKPSKIYISPALRAQNQSIALRPKPRKTAPDITNADYFPSLDAARPEKQRKKKNEPAFEEVRHGGRIHRIENNPQSAQPVVASNRFQSLDEEDS